MSERYFRNIIACWIVVLICSFFCRLALAGGQYVWINTIDGYRVQIYDMAVLSSGQIYCSSYSSDSARAACYSWINQVQEGYYKCSSLPNSISCENDIIYVYNVNTSSGYYYYKQWNIVSEDMLYGLSNRYSGETCPQSAVFCHVGGKRCEAKGCSISVWQDSNGKCGNIVTTDCTPEDIEYCNNNDAWDADVRVCITGNNEDDFKQALQDVWSHKCCYSYMDWRDREEIQNLKYYMVDNYDPNKDKQIPNINFNATNNSTVVVAPLGGISGNASVENATTSDLADYLAAIQANTAAIAASLEKLNITGIGSGSGSTGVYTGSGSSTGVNGSGSGSGNVTIDWGQGEVEALTQEDFNTDIDVPGDIEAQGNATYGEGVTDVIENMPIISALRGSGVELQDMRCAITGEVYGHTFTIDFCNDTITNMLQLMGTIIYGVSIFVFFFIVFTF